MGYSGADMLSNLRAVIGSYDYTAIYVIRYIVYLLLLYIYILYKGNIFVDKLWISEESFISRWGWSEDVRHH